MNELILYEVKNKVAIITLNDPENRNAWSWSMMNPLLEAIERLKNDASAKVGILTGNGPAFSAGANLKDKSTH